MLVAAPVPEEPDQGAHRDAERDEAEGDGHDRDGGRAQALGDVVADGARVVLDRRTREAGEQGGHQGDGDDGLGQAPDELRVGVGAVTGAGHVGVRDRRGGQLGDDEGARLVGEDEQNGPLGEHGGPAQPVALPVEPQPQLEAGLPQIGDHRQRLDHQAEEHADAEQPYALGRDVLDLHVGVGGGAVDPDEHAQRHDDDDVVQDGRPHHRAELAARVEDLPHHHVDAHEEDRGQEVAGEGDGDLVGRGIAGDGVRQHADEKGRREHGQPGERGQGHHHQRQQAVGVRLAAVLVLLHRADELRDEDGVQTAAHGEDVDHRR
jgi:hypothetical protein